MANNIEDPSPEKTQTTVVPPPAPTQPPSSPSVVSGDVETHSASVFKMPTITKSWRREDLYRNISLALRGMGLLFSFLALIVMATNNHGDNGNFVDYEAYCYLLAIAVISTVYTGGQVYVQVHELLTGIQTFSRQNLTLFNFIGDQITAYLLITAGSAAVPTTNFLRKGSQDSFTLTDSSDSFTFTDSAAAAIAMAFLAFFVLALSALVSGYKLSHQSYI